MNPTKTPTIEYCFLNSNGSYETYDNFNDLLNKVDKYYANRPPIDIKISKKVSKEDLPNSDLLNNKINSSSRL